MTRASTRSRKQSTRKRKAVAFTEPEEQPVSQEPEKKQRSDGEYSRMTMTGAEMDTLLDLIGDDLLPVTEAGMSLLSEVAKETAVDVKEVEGEDDEDGEGEAEGDEEGEEKKDKKKRRSRVFVPLSADEMTPLFTDEGAFLLPDKDPFYRKLRRVIKTARMMPLDTNPYIHNGHFHISSFAFVVKVPLNGRSAKRYDGASTERGVKALAALDVLGIQKVTLSFMNDLGFGSTAARKIRAIWDVKGQCVEGILHPPSPHFCECMDEALANAGDPQAPVSDHVADPEPQC